MSDSCWIPRRLAIRRLSTRGAVSIDDLDYLRFRRILRNLNHATSFYAGLT